MKNISVIGISGSIGTQTVDVVRNNPTKFQLVGFSVYNNIEYAKQLLDEFDTIKMISVKSEADVEQFRKYDVEIVYGKQGLIDVSTKMKPDILITAVVGAVGLPATVAAIKQGITIGLANKETLVTAGHIIMPLAKEYNVDILPVDSEHSAIFQCLNGEKKSAVKKLIITASGGSFRDYTRDQLKEVTVEQALNHPNWSMGAKITIDSATMFNKGLEIIEAHHLFGVDYDNIEALIHPQSVVHSMVEFVDNSVIAQLGTPDMRLPIQYALSYPKRMELVNSEQLDLIKIGKLNFRDVDLERYPAVEMAYFAGRTGGSMPTVLNAANEVAVDLFLNKKIKFLEIEEIVKTAMDSHNLIENPSLDEIMDIDKKIRNEIYARYEV